jgi:hypothetical protein
VGFTPTVPCTRSHLYSTDGSPRCPTLLPRLRRRLLLLWLLLLLLLLVGLLLLLLSLVR